MTLTTTYSTIKNHRLNTAVTPNIFARLNRPVRFRTNEMACSAIKDP